MPIAALPSACSVFHPSSPHSCCVHVANVCVPPFLQGLAAILYSRASKPRSSTHAVPFLHAPPWMILPTLHRGMHGKPVLRFVDAPQVYSKRPQALGLYVLCSIPKYMQGNWQKQESSANNTKPYSHSWPGSSHRRSTSKLLAHTRYGMKCYAAP